MTTGDEVFLSPTFYLQQNIFKVGITYFYNNPHTFLEVYGKKKTIPHPPKFESTKEL